MATTINSNTTDGVVITPDTSGEIELQANGVTKAKITANGLQDNNGNSLRGGSFRNFIINGDMNISQRGISFTSINGYTLDRFRLADSNDGAVTVTQDTDVPSGQGFANSLKIDVTTADTSIGASQFAFLQHRIEGQNLQHLKYGTSSAEKITLSFWVKSNKTGTYCISVIKFAGDGTRYDYVEEYTISSASTWEKKTITISPDSNIQSSSGAIKNDNTAGLYVQWTLADGSSRHGTNEIWNTSLPSTSTSNQVNFMDNTSNELYLTGLQLEVGEGASDFEHLPYDVQLQRCQRYCIVYGGDSNFDTPALGTSYSNTAGSVYVYFPVEMRAIPSLSVSAVSDWQHHIPGVIASVCTGLNVTTQNSKKIMGINVTQASNATHSGAKASNLRAANKSSSRLTFSSEL